MFSHDLCIEELNDLVQLPMASHKTEQSGRGNVHRLQLARDARRERIGPDHSILSVHVG